MKKVLILAVSVLITVFVSCKDKDEGTKPEENKVENTVKLSENSTHGKVMTNAEGKTLYFFSNDSKGVASCEGNCAAIWPAFYTKDLLLDEGLNSTDFTTITRTDGSKQTAYKGWPLYTYAQDSKAGEIKGDGVNSVWYVAKPDYSLMYANAQLVGRDGKNYIINDAGAYVEGEGKTKYFTDALGRTLYIFSNDKKATNTFTNSGFSNNNVWPTFHVTINRLPSVISKTDFSTIKVHGTKDQLTYKGWPLYNFGEDASRGDNKGVSVPTPGIWPVVNITTAEAPAQ